MSQTHLSYVSDKHLRHGGSGYETIFATHLRNPLVVYKAFRFVIILSTYSCLAHSATIAMISCYFFTRFFSSHIVHENACARAGSHACIVAHMDLYIIVMAYSHTQVQSTLAHT